MQHNAAFHLGLHCLLSLKQPSGIEIHHNLTTRELDVSPGNTEVKPGKFVEFISLAEGYFRETYKSQYINPISPTPKFTLGIIQIKVKSLLVKYLLPCCCIHDSIKCFFLFLFFFWGGGGGGVRLGAKYLLPYDIPFN